MALAQGCRVREPCLRGGGWGGGGERGGGALGGWEIP